MTNFPDTFTIKDKVEFLQRKILVNSICYYYYDKPVMTDHDYDAVSKELVELQKTYTGESQYGYLMADFDGTTGFDLYDRLNEYDKRFLTNLAGRICLGKTVVRGEKI